MLYAICCMLFAICCMLYAVCCMLYAVCCMLYAVCYMLYAICCMLYAVCYMLYAICCMLYAIRCMLYAVCYMYGPNYRLYRSRIRSSHGRHTDLLILKVTTCRSTEVLTSNVIVFLPCSYHVFKEGVDN